jgi:histone H3/H4
LSASVLYGLGAVNTTLLALAAGAGGVMFTQFVFSPLLPLPLRLSGVLIGVVPVVMRNARQQRARRTILIEIRRLLADLAVALRYEAAPGKALAMAAARDDAGLAHRRLRAFMAGRQTEPEKVLARLADDLRSPELQRLVRRMGAARRGGLAFERALSQALDEVVEESEAAADAEIESAPEKLNLPMIVALMTPALILLVFPIGFYILAQLTRI